MEPTQYDYLVADYEDVVLINVLVEADVISCNFAAFKKRLDKKQRVYCPVSDVEFEILLPDDVVDLSIPSSMAGDIILHRVKDDIIATTTRQVL